MGVRAMPAGIGLLIGGLLAAAVGSGCASADPSLPEPAPAATSVAASEGPTTGTTTMSAEATPTADPGSAGSDGEPAPVIVIDPGHSGRSIRHTAAGGLRDIDYPNYPEIYEMFDVSVCVARALRTDGYTVVLTKKRALASVSHTRRAAIANRAGADLAISVHDDHSQPATFQATYSQLGVRHDGRFHAMYRGEGEARTVFDLPEVVRTSHRYARIIARERTREQRRTVRVRENSFDGRAPLEPGNLALVQLWAEVPWVYQEMGALTEGDPTRAMSITSELRYARGLLTGVEAAVPPADGAVQQPSSGYRELRRCLIRRVEPTPGEYTRPTRYLPAGWR